MKKEYKERLDQLFADGIVMDREFNGFLNPYGASLAEEYGIIGLAKKYNSWKKSVIDWFLCVDNLPKRSVYKLLLTDGIPNKKNYDAYYSLDAYKYVYSQESIGLLKEMIDKIREIMGHLENLTRGFSNSDLIHKIEMFKNSQNGLMSVYVNENYDDPVTPRTTVGSKRYWDKFYEIAKNGKTELDVGVKKYFNSRKDNPIYKRGYQLTKILSTSGKNLVANPEIMIKIKKRITRQKG